MNRVIASITFRQLLGRRRTVLLLLLGLLLVLVALVYRLTDPSGAQEIFAGQLLATFGIGTLLPLVALIVSTAALGAEIDDGTAVYLLSKPISRRTIVLTKLAVAWAVTAALTCGPMLVAGILAVGDARDRMVLAFAVSAGAGALAYCAAFLALSLVTGRALVIGLAYVLIWEGFLAGLFDGTRAFSIRQYTLAGVDALSDAGGSVLGGTLDPMTAAVGGALVVAAGLVIAVRRLSVFEIRGETG